jgi:serine phosphatase RsbU (regulator of sigma subunit)
MSNFFKSSTFYYTLFGAGFGFCFPICSILLDMLVFKNLPFSFHQIIYVHTSNYLHFVIDTAPFFLGLAFGVAGWKQDNIIDYHKKLQLSRERVLTTLKENEVLIKEQNIFLEKTVGIRTFELQESNEELKQVVEELHATLELINRQKAELDASNKNITASIRYALTIQHATLPNQNQMQIVFKDYLLIFLPKDIVSGDFYWIYQIRKENKLTTFVAVIDCTGHGVPGAFMAMISYSMMNEIVKTQQNYEPNKVLGLLVSTSQQTFNSLEDNEIHGNTDIVFLKLEEETKQHKAVFATTRRPLYLFRKSTQMLEVLRKDKTFAEAAKFQEEDKFANQEVWLQEDDVLYLFTDGFTDQNNAARQRFGTNKLENLLQNIGTLDIKEQRNELLKELEKHKKEEAQRDDITVLGIKF